MHVLTVFRHRIWQVNVLLLRKCVRFVCAAGVCIEIFADECGAYRRIGVR